MLPHAALRGSYCEFASAMRRQSRHSDPSMAVRHRRLAVSGGPLGVRVGLSAAL